MKKNLLLLSYAIKQREIIQILRIMKCTVLLLFLLILQAHAGVSSQNARVNMSRNQLPLKEFMAEIERQTDYLFIYSDAEINASRQVSVKKGTHRVADLLNEVLSKNNISYNFADNYISLHVRKEAEAQSLAASPQQKKNTIQVSGTIVDTAGEPIIGANIKLKGAQGTGTITNVEGNFKLEVPTNGVLIVSFIGYQQQEVPVNGKTMLRIKIAEDAEVLDEVVSHFPEGSDTDEEDDRPKVAIIGKPNVGKSSIINKLVGKNRVIVSDIAGTTRDAIDTAIKYNGKEYVFIDTAGLRRKSKIKEDLERFSIIRTVAAVERADIAILVIDATEGVTEQDAKIAGIAHERGKGIIIAVNKWDDIEKNDKTIYEFTNKIKDTLAFMSYAEIIFVSAKTGQRLNKIYELVDHIVDAQTMRIPTGVLNEILTEAVAMKQPPSDKGKRLKIYYMTQVSVKPPTFVMFVNDVALTHFSYTRYIENRIRESFGFRGTSIRFINRERKEKE